MEALKRNRWVFWMASAVIVLVGAALAISIAMEASSGSPSWGAVVISDAAEVAQVQQAFSDAMTSRQSAGSPSVAYRDAALAAVAARSTVPTVPAEERDRMLADGRAELAKHFTPEQAKQQEVGLQNMVALNADPNRVNLGAGVSKVDFVNASVSGNSASIDADVTAWAKSEIRQASDGPWIPLSPVNTMRFHATLIQDEDGIWRVDSLVGDFLPGNEP